MENLINDLKVKIIEILNLEDVSVEEIKNDDPLFGDGLGLDSIDALELIVLLDKEYGIKITETIFQSVEVMEDYIQKNRTK